MWSLYVSAASLTRWLEASDPSPGSEYRMTASLTAESYTVSYMQPEHLTLTTLSPSAITLQN